MVQITIDNLHARYGANVEIWGDIDGDGNGTTIAAQINDAINTADARFDDAVRSTATGFVVPIVDSTGAVPVTVADAKRKLAGYFLKTPLGERDFDKDGKPINNLYADYLDAMRIIDDIRNKRLTFQ